MPFEKPKTKPSRRQNRTMSNDYASCLRCRKVRIMPDVKRQKTLSKHTALSLEIKSLFLQSRGSVGKRALRDLLKQRSMSVGFYLIQKLMNQQGLFGK